MIKNIISFIIFAGVFVFWTKAIYARFANVDTDTVRSPVVVELFTSQGCSSCPPADKLLGEIGNNENIIPLAFHVTYWDRLGWKDTLGQDFSTKRQQSYAAYKNSRRVYTPQMVVNGNQEFVGSDRATLNRTLKQNAGKIRAIEINKTADNVLMLKLPQLAKDGSLNYMIRLYGVKNEEIVQIHRGENRGKNITYHNGVIYEQPVGAWLGQQDTRIVKLPINNTDIDKYVILAQKGGFGEIVAAGTIIK